MASNEAKAIKFVGNQSEKLNEVENFQKTTGAEQSMTGRINFQLLAVKMKENRKLRRMRAIMSDVRKRISLQGARPPTLQDLLKAERKMYTEKTFNEIVFNYERLSYSDVLDENSFDLNLDESFDDEMDYLSFQNYANFMKYENAVTKIDSNKIDAAKKLLLDLVHDLVEPAMYAYAMLLFKEVIDQCDVLNDSEENEEIVKQNEETIRTAVKLLNYAEHMEPANSFLLGMMKRFNVGKCGRSIEGMEKCGRFMEGESWKEDLMHVVNAGRRHEVYDIEPFILQSIRYSSSWNLKNGVSILQNKTKWLKEMAQYALYEMTVDLMSKEHFNRNALKGLLGILSEGNLTESLYLHAAALLQSKLGTLSEKDLKEALRCLNDTVLARHEGAGLLLGFLPFSKINYRLSRDEIELCVRLLEGYVGDDTCRLDKENVDKLVHCLAVEYHSKERLFVDQNVEKAERLLRSRGMYKELRHLEMSLDESTLLQKKF